MNQPEKRAKKFTTLGKRGPRRLRDPLFIKNIFSVICRPLKWPPVCLSENLDHNRNEKRQNDE